MKYELTGKFYYPGTTVFKNKMGITDKKRLAEFEHHCFQARLKDVPSGDLSIDHLKQIHSHLFQDVYEWAGEIRNVAMSKGASRFAQPEFIDRELSKLIATIDISELKTLGKDDFASDLTHIISELNAIHPFLEGNGRTIRIYAQHLCKGAGYNIKISQIRGDEWNHASEASFYGDESHLGIIIKRVTAREHR